MSCKRWLLNREEASDWKWISLQDLQNERSRQPEIYTPWAKIIIRKMAEGNYPR